MTTSRRIKTTDRNTLSCEQKIKVTLWLQGHKDVCGKHDTIHLAQIASKDLGFSVGTSTIRNQRDIIHPDARVTFMRGVQRKANGGVLMQKIKIMQDEINALAVQIGSIQDAMRSLSPGVVFHPETPITLTPNS